MRGWAQVTVEALRLVVTECVGVLDIPVGQGQPEGANGSGQWGGVL